MPQGHPPKNRTPHLSSSTMSGPTTIDGRRFKKLKTTSDWGSVRPALGSGKDTFSMYPPGDTCSTYAQKVVPRAAYEVGGGA